MPTIKTARKVVAIATLANKSRDMAMTTIAALAFSEAGTRSQTIAAFQKAVGPTPTAWDFAKPDKKSPFYARLTAARQQAIIGRMAFTLPSNATPDKRIEAAAIIKALPASGSTATLAKGQTKRRTAAQDKAYGAAREYGRTLAADAGYSAAKSTKEKNTRKAAPAGSKSGANENEKGEALAAAKAPRTAASFALHISQQSAALLAFSNKHAKLAPLAIANAIHAFHSSVMAALPKEEEVVAA